MTNVKVTRHAAMRMKERNGLKKKSVQRIADLAYFYGYTIKDINGGLKHWIINSAHDEGDLKDIRIYGDKMYIFCGQSLVTLIQIPYKYTGRYTGRMIR